MNLFKMRGGGGLAALLIAIALVTVIGACKHGSDDPPYYPYYDPDDKAGVDFTNYQTGVAIRFRNYTNQYLVLFKNALSEGNILGGVEPYAGGEGHGITKFGRNTGHFAITGEFSVIVLTLDQYKQNRGNLQSQTDKPFTRLYVYYNSNGENEVLYEISDKLGGSYELRIENNSNLNVELRTGGIEGPTLGYSAKGIVSTTLFVMGGDYDIFPVFKRYNPHRDVLETIYPKNESNLPWRQAFSFSQSNSSRVFSMQEVLDQVKPPSSGVAYLLISNGALHDVRLYAGNTIQYDWQGVSYIPNRSEGKEFIIPMDGNTTMGFSQTRIISNYRIGVSGISVPIGLKGHTLTQNDTGPQLTLTADKIYTVTVKGSVNTMTTNPLIAEIDMDNATDLVYDFDTFY